MSRNLFALSLGLAMLAVAAVPSFWAEVDQMDGHIKMHSVPALDGHDRPEWARYAIVEMFPLPNNRARVIFSEGRPRLRGGATYITAPGHHGRIRLNLQQDVSWTTLRL